MKFIKLLWFDLKNGFLKNRVLSVPAILFAILFCFDVSRKMMFFIHENPGLTISLGDYFTYIYGGMKEYIPSPTEPFMFPVVWTITMLAISYATLQYPFRDLQLAGQQILYRTKGRSKWWLSKCTCNVLSTLGYHMIFLTIMVLFCIIQKGDMSLHIHKEVLTSLFAIKKEALTGRFELRWLHIVLPVFISIGLNLFQMTLSLFMKPVFSFFVTLILVLSSSYLLSPYLIGNYAMAVRSNTIIQNGVDLYAGLILCVVLITLSVIVGMAKFHHFDVLNKE